MKQCSICQMREAKYKCPPCEISYCSLACYRSHQAKHELPLASQESTVLSPLSLIQDRCSAVVKFTHAEETLKPAAKFTELAASESLEHLFTKHPYLRTELQAIYRRTQLAPDSHGKDRLYSEREGSGFEGRVGRRRDTRMRSALHELQCRRASSDSDTALDEFCALILAPTENCCQIIGNAI